jgi:hypothetical protein
MERNKDGIIGTVIGVGGVLDKNKKTDKAAAFGTAIGASIGSGKKWTFEDSLKLGATINALDSMKGNTTNGYSSNYTYSDDLNSDDSDTYISSVHSGVSYSGNIYDDLILDSDQEQQLEEAGIDSFEFELMDDDEKIEALEEAGLDPLDFDMY